MGFRESGEENEPGKETNEVKKSKPTKKEKIRKDCEESSASASSSDLYRLVSRSITREKRRKDWTRLQASVEGSRARGRRRRRRRFEPRTEYSEYILARTSTLVERCEEEEAR